MAKLAVAIGCDAAIDHIAGGRDLAVEDRYAEVLAEFPRPESAR